MGSCGAGGGGVGCFSSGGVVGVVGVGDTELDESTVASPLANPPSSVTGESGTHVDGDVAMLDSPFTNDTSFGSSVRLDACDGLAEFGKQRKGSLSLACINLYTCNNHYFSISLLIIIKNISL